MNNFIKIPVDEFIDDRSDSLLDELDMEGRDKEDIELVGSLSEREMNIFRYAFNAGYYHGSDFITENILGSGIDDIMPSAYKIDIP